MPSEIQELAFLSERESGKAMPKDPGVRRLLESKSRLWAALQVPGLEGQAGIFARLEDMQEALEALRRGGAPHQRDGAAQKDEAADWRSEAVAAIEDCQETLRRMEKVFHFVEGLLEDRAGQAHGSYSHAQRGAGRRPMTAREGAGNWEG